MILALETSTRQASLAVYERATSRLVDGAEFTTDRAHNAAIFDPLQRLVAAYRDRLAGIVVGLGPGSYGGVRVGLAVGQGLSVALGVPVIGGNSLEAWEWNSDSFLVVGDARRGSYFLALVRERRLQGEVDLVDEAEMEARLASYLEEGLPLLSADAKVLDRLPEAQRAFPSAARLAIRHAGEAWSQVTSGALEPIYLRAPYITTPKRP